MGTGYCGFVKTGSRPVAAAFTFLVVGVSIVVFAQTAPHPATRHRVSYNRAGWYGAPARAARLLRVMPLGDSIVYGQTDTAGAWRSHLWKLATAAGYSFQYVGSQTHGDFSEPPSSANEGHNEFEYADLNPLVAGWLADADPDIIMISVAPASDQPASIILNDLAVLLDTITDAKPDAYVLVSDVIRTNNAALEPIVLDINRNMPSILNPRIAAGKRIVAVGGMNEALTADDMADEFHPAQSGYDKMAELWWPALRQVLDTAVVTRRRRRAQRRENVKRYRAVERSAAPGIRVRLDQ